MSKIARVFLGILFALMLGAAVVCAIAVTKPDDFRYERSVVVNAPAAQVFPHVNDPKAWDTWSPWKDLDPNMAITFEGPEKGVGAVTRWKGNMNAGEGSMTVTESVEPSKVVYALNFIKPMPGDATAEFTLEPEGSNATKVTWAMYGKNNFAGKIMSVFIDCEEMMNEQFDKGLNSLKGVVEGAPAV